MIKLLLTLTLSIFSTSAFAQSKVESPCPSNEVLAAELLEFEISGVRVPNAKPNCVDKKKYANVGAEAPLVTEAAPPPKPFLVSETKPYSIRSIKTNKLGQIEVDFAWNVGSDDRQKPVLDKMVMSRFDGANRKYFGCAVMTVRPREAAVRPTCLNR